MGLASYLVYVGIYSSAISISQDSSLRRSIRKIALKESRLLGSIGTAQMEQRIVKRVVDLTARNQEMMRQETGISTSLDDDDVKNYLRDVLEEVNKNRKEM